MYINLLAAQGLSVEAVAAFEVIRVILAVIIALMSIVLIAVVIIQPSASNGVNPITGQSETFYGKNKSRTLEGLLRKLTVILAISIAVLTVLFFITILITGRQA
ncbi:MAG: preprotein translocase subunit SecG [Clostridiales bacterium]|nr:preprotein translocase subunit SecG [Clostridiales bacterium]